MASRRSLHPAGFVFLVAYLVLMTVATTLGGGIGEDWGIVLGTLLFGLLGAYLVAKRPSYRFGWFVAWTSVVSGVTAVSNNVLPDPKESLTLFEGFVGIFLGSLTFWIMFWMMLGLYPLLFPTGRPPSPRWRWVSRAGWISVAVAGALGGLSAQWCQSWDYVEPAVTACVSNPVGFLRVEADSAAIGIVLAILAAAISAVVRFRSTQGLERRQMKVFALGVASLVLLLVGGGIFESFLTAHPTLNQVQQLMWLVLPTTTAIAILRHGLYDIDRVISRTVSYLLILAILGSLFALVVVAIPETLGLDSNLGVAVATLSSFFAFRPLLRGIQKRVNRVFNRQSYDADRVLTAFATQIRDEVDPWRIADAWAGTVREALEPASISVWLRGA